MGMRQNASCVYHCVTSCRDPRDVSFAADLACCWALQTHDLCTFPNNSVLLGRCICMMNRYEYGA